MYQLKISHHDRYCLFLVLLCSAYNIFFKTRRAELIDTKTADEIVAIADTERNLDSTKDKSKPMNLFQGLALLISKEWKALDAPLRVKYDNLAKEEMEKYKVKLEEYQRKTAEEHKRRTEELRRERELRGDFGSEEEVSGGKGKKGKRKSKGGAGEDAKRARGMPDAMMNQQNPGMMAQGGDMGANYQNPDIQAFLQQRGMIPGMGAGNDMAYQQQLAAQSMGGGGNDGGLSQGQMGFGAAQGMGMQSQMFGGGLDSSRQLEELQMLQQLQRAQQFGLGNFGLGGMGGGLGAGNYGLGGSMGANAGMAGQGMGGNDQFALLQQQLAQQQLAQQLGLPGGYGGGLDQQALLQQEQGGAGANNPAQPNGMMGGGIPGMGGYPSGMNQTGALGQSGGAPEMGGSADAAGGN